MLLFTTVGIAENHESLKSREDADRIEETPGGSDSSVNHVLVRVPSKEEHLFPEGYTSVVACHPERGTDLLFPVHLLKNVFISSSSYQILLRNVEQYCRQVAECYPSLSEVEESLWSIADSYKNISRLTSIGKSYEGRDIWCLELSDNPGTDEDEPGVFFMGLHHAREWPTVSICLHIAEQLTSSYGINSTITDLIQTRRIWIVPCVNPDGYYYDHDQFQGTKMWRKNRHYFPEFDTYGVDLNRNYPGSSDGDPSGSWGSLWMGSASHDSRSEVYCGPFPASELETQAICSMFQQHDICACITWHTYSELVMWPWGYSGNIQSADDEYMAEIGREIAARIATQDGKGTYTPTQSAGLYPTTGDTTDWAYGCSHYVLGKTLFPYTIEACSSFHPSEDYLPQICRENYDGALYLLLEAANISKVIPRVMPPQITNITNVDDEEYILSWEATNPEAMEEYFQVREYEGVSLAQDDGESSSTLWVSQGFERDTEMPHSGHYSYKAQKRNDNVASMTSSMPIQVSPGMVLSYWCWYDLDEHADYAFVEISENGRSFTVLDTYTGHSEDWEYHQFPLDAYVGGSIVIRIRQVTDAYTLKTGFFIDDVYPSVTYFSEAITVNKTQETSEALTGLSTGRYYYSVRGYNAAHGWGDWSQLAKLIVSPSGNQPPDQPILTGPNNGVTDEFSTFQIEASDDDNDSLFYFFDWGDTTTTPWIGPYASDEKVSVDHVWSRAGTYDIQVKTQDTGGKTSVWSSYHQITIADTSPPGLIVLKPQRALYVNNQEVLPLGFSLVLGPLDVDIQAWDHGSGVQTVNISINERLVASYEEPPYTFRWVDQNRLINTIRIVVTDHMGLVSSAELLVVKCF